MLDWFRRLFAGDPGPPPDGVQVERDALGRVVSATATLRPGSGRDANAAYPPLTFTTKCQPALAAASEWLCERNIAAAEGWAIGLERNYGFDQADGRLVLQFEHAPDLVLDAQVLGSFDPSNRSFIWAWHNDSLRSELQQAAVLAREEGQRSGEAALTTPVQTVRFDELTPLLAFAAQLAGLDGVYRAMTANSTSVFLGYRLAGVPPWQSSADPQFAAQAHALGQRYDHDQVQQDRLYHEQQGSDDGTLLERIVAAKMISWRRDWARDDDCWHPCSTSWPSEHDRAGAYRQFVVPHPGGGVLDVTIRDSVGRTIYRIEAIDGAAKITDELIDWGNGFIWPRVD